ncbi:hypothetical protein E1212_09915 [Jiangella ureilytica]|uniref:Uncharacterized protein n=1 Tax=Jiangella ureilytica TaxID=2530374 RepID=A0A4R4RQI3_9ACTN|nr:hypothetical protein [Jiangella ureilytica]TDC52147.1 hypothetical protein E1212_09915 [Jiangella ureilytica]
MLPLHLLDDDTVEALLAGRPVTPGLAPLAGAVGELRAAARQPVRPSAELAQRLASGDFTGISPAPQPPSHRLRTWLAGVSPRARVVTGAVVLVTGLTAATAAGALPGGAQARMQTIIETVTPISFQRDEPAPDTVEDVRDPGSGRGDSSTTEDPGSPVTQPPGKPETPPGRPDEPGNPEKPESRPEEPPGKPESPPGKPESPPGKPESPPGKPESPPGKPESPGKPDTPPGQEDRPATPDQPNGNGGSQENGNGSGDGNGQGQGSGNGSGDRPHGPDRQGPRTPDVPR